MNTNETQEIEIPAEWDVTVQGAERRGIRIGIEMMRDAFCRDIACDVDRTLWDYDIIEMIAQDVADRLLAEQEEK